MREICQHGSEGGGPEPNRASLPLWGGSTIPRAMQIREKPNDPVSPDSRPGLLVVDTATVNDDIPPQ